MKSTVLACAVAAASLGFGSLASAQDYHREGRDRHDGPRAEQRDVRPPWQERQAWRGGEDRRGDRWQDSRRGERTPYPSAQYGHLDAYNQRDPYRHYGERGQWAANAPQYRRGDHVPYQYRQRQYYVNDWRAHRLYAPPQGYQWVRADDSGDYLLVAIATGLIANLLLSQ
jgi:Ni/Co efflux regulator RcnB